MKKNVSGKVKKAKKIVLDLDAALEEVAKKIRPEANGGCGNTNQYGTSGTNVNNCCPPGSCCY